MAERQTPFAFNEWYHCYNRGIDKRRTFNSRNDYQRFLQNLYLTNSSKKIHRSDYSKSSNDILFSVPRGEQIVAIGAFCLMPNHFHLLLKEVEEGGISKFMQALMTAYTMYFNIKNERTGGLFLKPFRSRHVANDRYLKHLVQYIHLNPAELFEPKWKEGELNDLKVLETKLKEYPYSSMGIYDGVSRVENAILDFASFKFLAGTLPPVREVLMDASDYYAEIFNTTVKASP